MLNLIKGDFPADRQTNNQYFVLTYNKTQEATVEHKNKKIEETSNQQHEYQWKDKISKDGDT